MSGKWVNGRWTPAQDVPKAEQEAILSSSGKGFTIPFRWEVAAYVALILIALLLRLWGLGDRAVHHDESLHGFFAWDIYQGRPYLHNPLTHGMFHFDSIALSFFLFGDSDFTMRVPMALFGTAAVALPLLLRPRMGQVAALLAAVMIVFSPALLYFSRFAREDMFMIFFTLALVGAMFRYIDERRERWLYVAAAVIALGFTTKETQYMTVAILGIYLVWFRWAEVVEWLMGRRSIKEFSPALGFLIVMGGVSLPLFAPGLSFLQDQINIILAAPANNTAGLPIGSPEKGWGYGIAIATTVILLIVSWVIGLMWNPRAWTISWLVFATIFSAFFTNFYTHLGGIGTGSWQALGYWLAQQEVQRGNQPWYYYFMITSAYEFLPMVLTVGTAAFFAFRSDRMTNVFLLVAAASFSVGGYFAIHNGETYHHPYVLPFVAIGVFFLLAFAMTARASSFMRFLLFWSIATFAAYTYAGEKMPWLLTHITLPFIIVAATSMGQVIMSIHWRFALRRGALFLLAAVPLFIFLVWRLIFIELQSSIISYVGLFLLLTTIGLLLVGLQWLSTRIGRTAALGSVALVFAMLMFGYTFRASWVATFMSKDVPQELLVYTQTTQDLKRVAEDIRLAGELTGEGKSLPVSIDTTSGFAWPWQWYLRGHDRIFWKDFTPQGSTADMNVEVAVIHANNNSKVTAAYASDFTQGRLIRHRAWFPEEYRDLTVRDFWETVIDRDRWRTAVDFFVYRRLPASIGSENSYVYFNQDLPLSPLQ